MTAFIEQIDVEAEYLLERGKPMPSKNHSKLESYIISSTAILQSYTLKPQLYLSPKYNITSN